MNLWINANIILYDSFSEQIQYLTFSKPKNELIDWPWATLLYSSLLTHQHDKYIYQNKNKNKRKWNKTKPKIKPKSKQHAQTKSPFTNQYGKKYKHLSKVFSIAPYRCRSPTISLREKGFTTKVMGFWGFQLVDFDGSLVFEVTLWHHPFL